jgi:Mg2+ and Co2+ transporter CorA
MAPRAASSVVVIPAFIAGVYGVTIFILEQRWRAVSCGIVAAATARIPRQ